MIVLDTHVLVWFVHGDERVGVAAREHIEQAAVASTIMIPAICAWELAMIERKGGSTLRDGSLAWIQRALALPGFQLAAMDPDVAVDSVMMSWSHKDPADRLIVATARNLGAPVLTVDRKILAYAAAGHLQAIDARR